MNNILFSTKKHDYTVADCIALFCFMIAFCAMVYIALVMGIPE